MNVENLRPILLLTSALVLACAQPAPDGATLSAPAVPPAVTAAAGVAGVVASDPQPEEPQKTPQGTPIAPELNPEPATPAQAPVERVLWSGKKSPHAVGFSADGTKVAYAVPKWGMSADLYVSDVETTETRLVDHDVVAWFPKEPILLSDGGSYLVYRKTLDGGAGSWHDMDELWAWEWSTGQTWMISADAYRSSYRLTPDGQSVVFVDTQSRNLVVHDLDSRESVEIDTNVHAQPHQDVHQTLAISADSRLLAYTLGSSQTGALRVVDLDTLEIEDLAQTVNGRSLRFLGGGAWLSWVAGEKGAQALVQRHLIAGDQRVTGVGTGFTFIADGAHVAYLRESVSGGNELFFWSRALEQEASVDSDVRVGTLVVSPAQDAVVYLRDAEADPDSYAWIGELWIATVADGERSLITANAWGQGTWPSVFSPNGHWLTYRTGACGKQGAHHALDLLTGASHQLPLGTDCGKVYMMPDSTGMTYQRSSPKQLVEMNFADGHRTTLGTNPKAFSQSPDATKVVYSVSGGASSGLLAADWATGSMRSVTETYTTFVQNVSDTHFLYRVNGTKRELRLATLP